MTGPPTDGVERRVFCPRSRLRLPAKSATLLARSVTPPAGAIRARSEQLVVDSGELFDRVFDREHRPAASTEVGQPVAVECRGDIGQPQSIRGTMVHISQKLPR